MATLMALPSSKDTQPNKPTNVVTQECVKYLLGNDDDKKAAFEHLTAILLHATHGLYIPSSDVSTTEDTVKYSFAQDFLLTELAPYAAMDEDLIRAAAAEKKFQYLGNKFRCRVLNRIRDVSRRRKRVSFVRFVDEWFEHASRPMPPNLSPDEFDKLLAECDFLNPKAIETAVILFDIRELRGAERTQALADRRGYSVQQARKDVRQVQDEITVALKSGDSAAKALFNRLAEHVRSASLLPRDMDFWDDANPGTSVQTAQFAASSEQPPSFSPRGMP